jgi:hypothetical protein
MLGAVTGNPSRNDLAPLCGKIPELLKILIIDDQIAVGAESADLPSVVRCP